ncbi:unnamed protein product [Protopolystoma xenopodis]|uniref:Uncharacterized protein n=1 Tax=Protopolystoma xenopodis TaxID=117903 RepID=A0A3S5AIX9_9PLAT|nr:unnamed protein product [Protopolystoma xenopodis]
MYVCACSCAGRQTPDGRGAKFFQESSWQDVLKQGKSLDEIDTCSARAVSRMSEPEPEPDEYVETIFCLAMSICHGPEDVVMAHKLLNPTEFVESAEVMAVG